MFLLLTLLLFSNQTPILRGEALYSKGVQAFQAQALEQARDHFEEALALLPPDHLLFSKTLYNLARSLQTLGRPCEASDLLDRFIKLAGERDEEGMVRLKRAHAAREQVHKACLLQIKPPQPPPEDLPPEPKAFKPEPPPKSQPWSLSLALSEGIIWLDGEPHRSQVYSELSLAYSLGWVHPELALAGSLEAPHLLLFRGGARLHSGPLFLRLALQIPDKAPTLLPLLAPGLELPLGEWRLKGALNFSLWPTDPPILPVELSLGVRRVF